MNREVFEIIESLERWAEYHGRKSDQDVSELAGRLRKLFTKEESVIQTPEEFWKELSDLTRRWESKSYVPSVHAAITTRDAAIKAEAREEKRVEIWNDLCELPQLDMAMKTFGKGIRWEVIEELPSLQPPKPAIDPQALELADAWLQTIQTELVSDGERKRLAALISERVKADGWKE
ncbi:MAG TPA: hypothetical protein VNH83_28245 [Bryobacteraceae bacterium]|nr:hypothetical protein [Bryobacteraceae bacterium]